MATGRRWFCTLNLSTDSNWLEGAWKARLKPLEDHTDFKRLVSQLEMGDGASRNKSAENPSEENGDIKMDDNAQVHIQYAVHFNKPIRFRALKRLIDQAHVEVQKGSNADVYAYCTKDETRVEGPYVVGKWTDRQGFRSDLNQLALMVQAGASDMVVFNAQPGNFLRYQTHITKLKARLCKPLPEDLEEKIVYLFWGVAGSGKTHYVNTLWKPEEMYQIHSSNCTRGVWMDNYAGQKILFIDDAKSWITLTTLLMMLDQGMFQAETKGGRVWVNLNRVVMTSNWHWSEWYDWTHHEKQYEALKRRIHHVIEFPTVWAGTLPQSRQVKTGKMVDGVVVYD